MALFSVLVPSARSKVELRSERPGSASNGTIVCGGGGGDGGAKTFPSRTVENPEKETLFHIIDSLAWIRELRQGCCNEFNHVKASNSEPVF